jgi:hypothetical protein
MRGGDGAADESRNLHQVPVNAAIVHVDFQVTDYATTQDLSGASVDGTVFIE